jgi:hypothetical protein
MNYLIILIKFKVSRFLCRSVYNIKNDGRSDWRTVGKIIEKLAKSRKNLNNLLKIEK